MLYWSPISFCPSFCSLSGWWNYLLTRKVVCKYLHGEQPCINVGMSKNNSLVLHGNGYSPAWSPQTLTHLDVEKCLPVLTYFIVGCMKQLPGEFKENNGSLMLAWEVLDYILLLWKMGKISCKISVVCILPASGNQCKLLAQALSSLQSSGLSGAWAHLWP